MFNKDQVTLVLTGWRTTKDLIANIEANKDIRASLDELNIPHWDAIGAYKEEGQSLISQEVSIIAHCKPQDINQVTGLVWEYEQDCVLVIDAYNSAWLMFPDHSCKHIGKLVVTTEDKAKEVGMYTYFLGEYYITEKGE